jgi:lysophospholipase L1-like esterase
MKKVLLRSAIVLAAVLATLAVLEVALRFAMPLRFRPNGDAPLFASRTYRLSADKTLVYEMRPNTQATAFGLEFAVNPSGFRDKRYPLLKGGKTRIVCVGDSLTYGWLVPLRATYHKQLESSWKGDGRPVEVMGMGVVGYNLVQEFALIRDRVPIRKPNLVLLQIGPNDFERTVGIKTVPETGKLVLIPYHDRIIPYMTDKTAFTTGLMRRFHLFRLLNMGLFGLALKSHPDYVPRDVFMIGEEDSFAHLAKIKRLLDREGIPLAVVIFPFQSHGPEYLYAALTARIRNELEAMGVPYLDLFDRLNRRETGDIWIDGLHLNGEGYGIVAAELKTFLAARLFKK